MPGWTGREVISVAVWEFAVSRVVLGDIGGRDREKGRESNNRKDGLIVVA
jgi:hypothetical protein